MWLQLLPWLLRKSRCLGNADDANFTGHAVFRRPILLYFSAKDSVSNDDFFRAEKFTRRFSTDLSSQRTLGKQNMKKK